jgi:indole-3-glycerol phosphate synthase
MNSILNTIVAKKKEEIFFLKNYAPLAALERKLYNVNTSFSLSEALRNKSQSGIIAEFKRRSPSKGNINMYADVALTTSGYINAGASALSVLTDENFFGGNIEDLKAARSVNNCPILRKDFIISEYQVIESKTMGADVILLIAAILSAEEILNLSKLAHMIGLEVLLEIHNREELDKLNEFIDVVGINNRNLNDFSVSLDRSIELFDLIPDQYLKISESGIDTPSALLTLKAKGFDGFLVGEKFMATGDPAKTCHEFIKMLQIIEPNKN